MVIRASKFWDAFESRDDLKQYGFNALLLFALQLKFGIEDIDIIAANSLTEGSDDKKADLVHIDAEEGYAVIAQTSISKEIIDKQGKHKEAKANKASGLNTAISWLLSRSIDKVPEKLKTHAEELRRVISEGTIKRLYIWYVHNLFESHNVKNELETVEHTTSSVIKTHFPEYKNIKIQALEIGRNTLDEWYKAILTPILVNNKFHIPITNGFEIAEGDWQAYVTAIPATWLFKLYNKYGTDLFSADVRDYLGSRGSDDNINNGIKKTAKDDPEHFWVYNNGITVLVHTFKETKKDKLRKIHIKGFSIVNGAQTTGSIGNLKKSPKDDAMVQVRFITCVNQDTLRRLVKYNNTQNKMLGPDSRSNDPIQIRLIKEFDSIPNILYSPRRGGREDIIKRKSDNLPSVVAGQALAAFHGDPDIAYHEKTHMWDDNTLYSAYFNDQTTAKHILFALSLMRSIEKKKITLWNKSKDDKLVGKEKDQFIFFRNRGSILMMTSAIAGCLEDILNKQIPNKFNLAYRNNISLETAIEMWTPIVNIASAFTEPLIAGLADGFKAHDTVNKAKGHFQSLMKAIIEADPEKFNKFKNYVR